VYARTACPAVTAITKCLIRLGALDEPVHSGTEGVELHVAAPATDGPRCSMKTTMSKTTTRHNSEATPEGRELRDDELEGVSGGGKRPDGTGGGNVAGGWDLTANKVHA
jgi:hypothetical protein